MEIINKKFIKSFLLIIFVIAIFIISSYSARITRPANIHIVKIAGQDIVVDVATTVQQHQQGLSGRAGLKENEGMLFIFKESGKYVFWMKDMNFPIDIIWINEDWKVVYVKKDARPEFFPEQYSPTKDAKYVLEVVSGFSEKYNLKVGDVAVFKY